MPQTPPSRSMLVEVTERLMAVPCLYVWGAKPDATADTSTVTGSDCSGFSLYAIAKATNQAWILPEGSDEQHQYFEGLAQQGLVHKLAQYSDVQYAADDPARLFIGFIEPGAEGPGEAGHVIFVMSAAPNDPRSLTLECHGANAHGNGVDRRPWDTPVLAQFISACYEIPSVA